MIGEAEIARRFHHHPPDAERVVRHGHVRRLFLDLAVAVDELAPDGREKSLAVTALEEAMFWANAAIARPESQSEQRGVALAMQYMTGTSTSQSHVPMEAAAQRAAGQEAVERSRAKPLPDGGRIHG